MSDMADKMANSGRAVGYCLNDRCSDFAVGRVLTRRDEGFLCTRCERYGRIEHERGRKTGAFEFVSEIQVEFNYDPVRDLYLERTSVRDERLLQPQAIYKLKTPMVQTQIEAANVGRVVMAAINRKLERRPRLRNLQTRAALLSEGWQTLV
jgi:hypothetical protein